MTDIVKEKLNILMIFSSLLAIINFYFEEKKIGMYFVKLKWFIFFLQGDVTHIMLSF